MNKETISCRIEVDKRAVLDAIAEEMNCDRSHILNEAIDLYLESHYLKSVHINLLIESMTEHDWFRVTTKANSNAVIESDKLNRLKHLKSEHEQRKDSEKVLKAEKEIRNERNRILKLIRGVTSKFLDSKKSQGEFTEENPIALWRYIRFEQFPERSSKDASWIATEEDSLVEFQSRTLRCHHLAIDSRDAQRIIHSLKAGYNHSGSLDWFAVEDTIVLYYRLECRNLPFQYDRPSS